MFELPKNTVLGELKIERVFQFYDIPRLFLCKNRSGFRYFVLSIFDDGDNFDWFYVPISSDRLLSVLKQGISLREVFTESENGFVYKVSVSVDKNTSIEIINAKDLDESDLPKAGIYLDTDEKVLVGLGAIDPKEASTSSRRETYNLRLYPWDSKLPEFDVRRLGGILTSIQELIDAIGQYCVGEPTIKGAISAEILSATRFKATQIFEGSFGIQLKSDLTSDLFHSSLASDTLLELTQLLSLGDNEDSISNKLHEMKGRVASKYRRLLKELAKADSPLKVDWGSPNIERGGSVSLSKETIQNTYKLVSKIDTEMSEEVIFKAELLGLDVTTKRYRVRHLTDNEDYAGKVAEESFDQVQHSEINGIYEVTLKKLTETNASSGSEHTKWILFGLRAANRVKAGS